MNTLKPYQKKLDYSYTLGAFPTLELLKHQGETVKRLLVNSETDEEIIKLLSEHSSLLPEVQDKLLKKLSPKENTYVIGVFEKYQEMLLDHQHLVLVDPSNFGNLGTMIRTALAFGIKDIALIGEPCDHFNPQVIRSSMGALFSVRIQVFEDIAAYRAYFKRPLYSLMSDGQHELREISFPSEPFSIILGNESTGLPKDFHHISTSVRIDTTNDVDSLNITSACSIALYQAFRKDSF